MPYAYGGQSQQRWHPDTLNKNNIMQDMVLADLDGEPRLTASARKAGMLVLAFFHTGCPTSALLLPYLQKLSDAYQGTGKVTVWGVSQDDESVTRAFVQQHGVGFPVCLDHDSYHSMTLGVVAVPTLFLVNSQGEVLRKIVGWDRNALNAVSAEIARFAEQEPVVIVPDDDPAPPRRFGSGSRTDFAALV